MNQNQIFVDNIDLGHMATLAESYETWENILGPLLESARAGELDRLENEDCIQSYGKWYLSDRSNLMLVGSAPGNATHFIEPMFVPNELIDKPRPPLNCAVDPVPWICPKHDCEVACINRLNEVEPHNWTITVGRLSPLVDYCLSQPTEESCKLQFSLPIVMVIVFFGSFKMAIMLILTFGLREARVQTIGDAIASFLIQPDDIVNGRCLYSASDFKQERLLGNPRYLIFTNKSMRFAETSEKRVWLLTYIS